MKTKIKKHINTKCKQALYTFIIHGICLFIVIYLVNDIIVTYKYTHSQYMYTTFDGYEGQSTECGYNNDDLLYCKIGTNLVQVQEYYEN